MQRITNTLLLIWTCGALSVDSLNFLENITGYFNEEVYDLCIIGAGFFGSTAARHASAYRDLKICLIGLDEPPNEREYEERDIYSSHYDSGRILMHMFDSPAYQKLVQASIRQFGPVEQQSGIQFHNPVSFLRICDKNNASMKRLEDISAAVRTPFRTINDQQSMDKIFPFIKLQDFQYGLHDYAGTGVINPRRMVKAEMKVAAQQGCHIIVDKVENVEPLKNNYHIIETANHGIIKSNRVLFTTGSFTNVDEFDVLPQFEVDIHKEMAALVRLPDEEAERLRYMPSMIYRIDTRGRYIVPPVMYPDGKTYIKIGRLGQLNRIVQTKEEIKREVFLSNETNELAASIAEVLFDLIPGLKSDGISRKLCVISKTPTSYPYIDQWTPTVTVAIFGNGWGATTSEEIGRLAAHLSLFGIWDSEIPKSLFEIVTKKETY